MDGGMPVFCGHDGPLAYNLDGSIYLFAGSLFTPNFWLAQARRRPGAARFIARRLPVRIQRRLLERFDRFGAPTLEPLRPEVLLQRLLSLIEHGRIQVYELHGSEYWHRVSDPNDHLVTDCHRIAWLARFEDPAHVLRYKRLTLSVELSELISERWGVKLQHDAVFWREPVGRRALIMIGGAMHDIGESVAALAHLGFAAVRLAGDSLRFQLTMLQHVGSGDLTGARQELERVGLKVEGTWQDLRSLALDGLDILNQLRDDPPTRRLLIDFFQGLVSSTPHVDQGKLVLAISLEVLIALGTLGLGSAVMASGLARRVGHFSAKALEQMVDLARALRVENKRQVGLRQQEVAFEPQSPGRFPSDDYPPASERRPEADASGGRGAAPPPVMTRYEPPCFQPGSKVPANKYPEYDRQLAGQERGLNTMSVQEYLEGRERYEQLKRRGTGAAQRAAREDYKERLVNDLVDVLAQQGMVGAEAERIAAERARKRMKALDALHNPDLKVGGKDRVTELGDRQVNRSIGSHWSTRVHAMDVAALQVPSEQRAYTKMNVKLERCQ